MVLHLLGKKSWNVYSPANVDRVKRDEEAARLAEEAEEDRGQAEDAARRLRRLRGEPSPEPETHVSESRIRAGERRSDGTVKKSNKRKHGDDFESILDRREKDARDSARRTKITSESGHINFWADLEEQKESKKMVEPNSKKQDLANKPEEGVALDQGERPWYSEPKGAVRKVQGREAREGREGREGRSEERREIKIAKSKDFNDPLNAMNAYLSKRKEAKQKSRHYS